MSVAKIILPGEGMTQDRLPEDRSICPACWADGNPCALCNGTGLVCPMCRGAEYTVRRVDALVETKLMPCPGCTVGMGDMHEVDERKAWETRHAYQRERRDQIVASDGDPWDDYEMEGQ